MEALELEVLVKEVKAVQRARQQKVQTAMLKVAQAAVEAVWLQEKVSKRRFLRLVRRAKVEAVHLKKVELEAGQALLLLVIGVLVEVLQVLMMVEVDRAQEVGALEKVEAALMRVVTGLMMGVEEERVPKVFESWVVALVASCQLVVVACLW